MMPSNRLNSKDGQYLIIGKQRFLSALQNKDDIKVILTIVTNKFILSKIGELINILNFNNEQFYKSIYVLAVVHLSGK